MLVVVETTDLVFAVDSIPAIFAITDDPFIVFTSNVFAILGLRSLYFLLAGVMDRFNYLKLGLAVVLIVRGREDADRRHLPRADLGQPDRDRGHDRGLDRRVAAQAASGGRARRSRRPPTLLPTTRDGEGPSGEGGIHESMRER